jgi:hypothetical protein
MGAARAPRAMAADRYPALNIGHVAAGALRCRRERADGSTTGTSAPPACPSRSETGRLPLGRVQAGRSDRRHPGSASGDRRIALHATNPRWKLAVHPKHAACLDKFELRSILSRSVTQPDRQFKSWEQDQRAVEVMTSTERGNDFHLSGGIAVGVAMSRCGQIVDGSWPCRHVARRARRQRPRPVIGLSRGLPAQATRPLLLTSPSHPLQICERVQAPSGPCRGRQFS